MGKVKRSNNGLDSRRNWEDILQNGQGFFMRNWTRTGSKNMAIEDFELVRTIGVGGNGRVVLAKDRRNQEPYAIKIIYKEEIVRKNRVQQVLLEKRIWQSMKFPFVVDLLSFFQDNFSLYFVMPFLAGGDMYSHLGRKGKLSESDCRFYAAQLVLAFEFLHSLGVVYRDLKMENILLDRQGYLKIVDLGYSKLLEPHGRTYSVVGTPEYLAPEVIAGYGYGQPADMWSLGVLLWELVAGYLPFSAPQRCELFQLIHRGKTAPAPAHFTSSFRDLTRSLIEIDPLARLDVVDTKKHGWFNETDWQGVLNQEVRAPWIPKLRSSIDTRCYNSYPDVNIKKCDYDPYEDLFKDF